MPDFDSFNVKLIFFCLIYKVWWTKQILVVKSIFAPQNLNYNITKKDNSVIQGHRFSSEIVKKMWVSQYVTV